MSEQCGVCEGMGYTERIRTRNGIRVAAGSLVKCRDCEGTGRLERLNVQPASVTVWDEAMEQGVRDAVIMACAADSACIVRAQGASRTKPMCRGCQYDADGVCTMYATFTERIRQAVRGRRVLASGKIISTWSDGTATVKFDGRETVPLNSRVLVVEREEVAE